MSLPVRKSNEFSNDALEEFRQGNQPPRNDLIAGILESLMGRISLMVTRLKGHMRLLLQGEEQIMQPWWGHLPRNRAMPSLLSLDRNGPGLLVQLCRRKISPKTPEKEAHP